MSHPADGDGGLETEPGPPRDPALPREPWFLRIPLPLPLAGLLLGCLGAALALLAGAVASPIDYVRQPFEARLPIASIPGILFSFWVLGVHIKGARADVDAMKPKLLAAPDQISAARSALTRPGWRSIWVGGVLGGVVGLLLQELNVARWSRFATGEWNAFDAASAAGVLGSMVILGQMLAFVVSSAFAMRRLADLLDVRLFDSRVAEPLVRFGLRTTFLYGVLPMILVSVVLALGAAELRAQVLGFFLNVGVAALCMVVPVQRLQGRLSRLRREELDRVERAIAGDGTALEESPMDAMLDGIGLADLLTYRRELEAMPTWPFRGSTVWKLAAYLILPPASWAAAAFVERLIDSLLSR